MSELRGLGAVHEDLRARGGTVVALSVDSPAQARAVHDKQRLPFPVLADESREVVRRLGLLDGALALPAQLLVATDGTVRWRHVSRTVQDRLDPAQTAAAVRALLAASASPR